MDPGSPATNLLNIGLLGPNPAFGQGGQPSNEQGFDNDANNQSIESMLPLDTTGSLSTSAHMGSLDSSLSGMAPFQSSFNHGIVGPTDGLQRARGSPAGFPDAHTPMTALRTHRLSMNSNGPFVRDGQDSVTGSDSTSPRLGTLPFAHNSNETVTAQAQADNSSDKADAAPPPWSELKTKAGKDRKRLPLACIACRRKKIRCSGEKPACKHCLRSRIPCVYKLATRKAAPRTDYMAMLDKRLKRMEDRILKILPKEEHGIVASTGRAVLKPMLPGAPDKSKCGVEAAKKRGALQAFGDDLDEWAASKGAITLDPNDAQGVEASTGLQAVDGEDRSLLLEGQDKLPPKDIQEHLAEVFFDHVYGQSYYLLHKPSFMRKLAQGTVPPVLILSVCAMAARFSAHPSLRSEPAFLRGEEWAAPARDIALRRYDRPNITILTAYLILGLHEFGTCQGGRSWMFGGMAQRMAFALQLHNDLDPHHPPQKDGGTRTPGMTPTDREIRRRTMWAVFQMDKLISSGTERPGFVEHDYIKAQLPIKERYYQMEITGPTEDMKGNVPNPVSPESGEMSDVKSNMGVAAYSIRLISILGKVYEYQNLGGRNREKHDMWANESIFQTLRRSLTRWESDLPSTLAYTPENLESHATDNIANQFLLMHIMHHHIRLFMNRFALPTVASTSLPSAKDIPTEFLTESARSALEAANKVSELIHHASGHSVTAPFAGYCAFYSSTVHIQGAFSTNGQVAANSKEKLAWNVKYLTKMKKYWGMFHFMTENLRDIYRRQADAARATNANRVANASTPATEDSTEVGSTEDGVPIFQYGDWFNRYPHGVSGADFEDPLLEVKREPGSDAVLGQKSDLHTVEEFFSKMTPPSARNPSTSEAARLPQRRPPKKRNSGKTDLKPSMKSQNTGNAGVRQSVSGQHNANTVEARYAGEMMSSPTQEGKQGHTGQPQSFPPQFASSSNAPLVPQQTDEHQQLALSQLDRKMVLSSYVDADLSNNSGAFDGLQLSGGDYDFDMSHFAPSVPNNTQHDGGLWADPSTAWFMPFNLEPPTMGEDGNLFGGNFDWQTAFSGLGDGLGDIPPTGLTPRAENVGGNGNGAMEGLQ